MNPIKKHLNRLPKVLYKYRSFDSNDYGLNLLISGDAYFVSAKNFNDPFEAYFIPKSIILQLDGEKLNNYLRRKVLMHFPDSKEENIQILINKGLEQRRWLLEGDQKAMEAVLKIQYRNFGIFSLTPIPDSIPMWAYYSDSHEGFCVGLDTSIIAEHQLKLLPKDQLLILHKVNYQKNMPVCNVDVNPKGQSDGELKELELTLYTKSTSWRHEKEYRLLYYDHPATVYSFGKEAVTEVIIGINTCEKNKTQLIERLTSDNPSVKIKQAKKSINSYEIELIDI